MFAGTPQSWAQSDDDLLEELGGANHSIVVAERIQEALGEGFLVQGHEIYASASIGITLSNPDYDRPEDVLRDADTAMYRAKARCRGVSNISSDDLLAINIIDPAPSNRLTEFEANLAAIAAETGVHDILNLPATRVFKIRAKFDV